MPRKKSKGRMYFDMDVQNAIIEYNSNPENYSLRNKLYKDEIHPAFDKLSENIINTFKFTYFDDVFDDVKHEVVAFMVMNIHKYDHTKGSKAFSYFSIVAKNYLILHNNNNYKRYKSHTDISKVRSLGYNDGDEKNEDLKIIIQHVIKYFDSNIPSLFKKEKDRNIAYSIVDLFKHKDDIENFNKKSLYILIREMTNVETVHITKVVNVFKKHYAKILKQFYEKGDFKQNINFFK
tara:strand:+ start:388 stop:1092 length:705 start_codon:yes stop_codon:yes gene_type:complete